MNDFGAQAPYRPPASQLRPSPIFLLVIVLAAAGGIIAWHASPTSIEAKTGVFMLVLFGWIVSVCLHEFGHAFVAYKNGDRDVAIRGYLTLNPLKYSNPVLSILLPVLFIAIGGIGLPGGAVYLRTGMFRPAVQTRVSLAGPLANLVVAIALLVVIKQYGMGDEHQVFWFGLSFLAFLQVMAVVLNLLPVPGLDGYAAIEPYLSPDTRNALAQFKGFGLLILVAFLFVPQINQVFFGFIYFLFGLSGVPADYAQIGGYLMRIF